MPKRKLKHPFIVALVLLITLSLIGIGIAHFESENMVTDFLERKLPDHIALDYRQMDVNVLTGTVKLSDVDIKLFDRDSMLLHTEVEIQTIALKGLGYWQFFFKESIEVDELYLQRPKVHHYLNRTLPKKENEPLGVVKLLKTIKIEELIVADGYLTLLQEAEDSVAFETKEINFSMKEARTGPEQIKEKIPVTYGDYSLIAKKLFVNLGPFEELHVDRVLLDNGNVNVKQLALNSKFTKAELSRQIQTERDHVDLKIPEATLEAIAVAFTNDTLSITTGPSKITKPTAEIFRDKLVADDRTKKKLYGQILRLLPIYINIPKIEIFDGRLVYSEKIDTEMVPGKISFNNIGAVMQNLANAPSQIEKTIISAEANLMNHAPFQLDWSFDISNTNDTFTASGILKNFETKSINNFLESNLRAKAKGTIDRMYFTVSGDAVSSSGDMKMKYKDFEFSVLKKNRVGVNKLLTAIGRIFINDGSNADENGFRYGNIKVERDPSKSFFNYLWLNVRDGTVNTLVGNGEK